MLEVTLIELGVSYDQFLVIANKGLAHEEDKKYFEQLIANENFLYFKNMMLKRNIQLEDQAFKLMMENDKKTAEDFKLDPEWINKQKKREQNELDAAIAMSMALEEEKRRLRDLEDEDIRVIINNLACFRDVKKKW
jgi:hypothetical protein